MGGTITFAQPLLTGTWHGRSLSGFGCGLRLWLWACTASLLGFQSGTLSGRFWRSTIWAKAVASGGCGLEKSFLLGFEAAVTPFPAAVVRKTTWEKAVAESTPFALRSHTYLNGRASKPF